MKRPEPTPDLFPADAMPFNLVGEAMPEEIDPMKIVKIKPEWEGDSTFFFITEWNGDRGFISPVEWPYGEVRPQELVTSEMIETSQKP